MTSFLMIFSQRRHGQMFYKLQKAQKMKLIFGQKNSEVYPKQKESVVGVVFVSVSVLKGKQ